MKILIDIGHPAHVHYFRDFIKRMKSEDHSILVSARDKEVTQLLLEKYDIEYFSRGKGKTGMFGKLFYILIADLKLLRKTRSFKPDVYLSFVSPYAAQVAWLRRKPHITFDDTEHATIARKFYLPFSKIVLTPFYFRKDLGSKQMFFNGLMEQSYLSKDVFSPDKAIVEKFTKQDSFAVLRFISWNASHDIGKKGLTPHQKELIIDLLRASGRKIVISSESAETFKGDDIIQIPPSEFHHFLYFADLVISEGGTTSNEAAMLGTPTILINELLEAKSKPGVHYTLEENELQKCFVEFPENIKEVIVEMLDHEYKRSMKIRLEKFLSDKTSPTEVLINLLKKYE